VKKPTGSGLFLTKLWAFPQLNSVVTQKTELPNEYNNLHHSLMIKHSQRCDDTVRPRKLLKVKRRVKSFLCLIILDLGTRLRWVVSFTPQAALSLGERAAGRHPLDKRLRGVAELVWTTWRTEKSFAPAGFWKRVVRPVAIPTEPSRLLKLIQLCVGGFVDRRQADALATAFRLARNETLQICLVSPGVRNRKSANRFVWNFVLVGFSIMCWHDPVLV
jgi:hypothetical protein